MRTQRDDRSIRRHIKPIRNLLLPILIIALMSGVSEGQWERDKKEMIEVVRQSKPVGLEGSKLKHYNLRSDLYIGLADRSPAGRLEPFFSQDSGHLGNFLTLSEPPSRLDSPYVKITKNTDPFYGKASYESMLAQEIVKSKGNLRPADVMKMSLQVCQNDYLLATLTAHNLLKETAYQSREASKFAVVGQSGLWKREQREIHANAHDITAKLANLRPHGDKFDDDLLGPWYHAFGLLFVGAAVSSSEAAFTGESENALRYARLIDSPYDPTEAAINTWAAGLSGDLNRTLAATPLSVTISGDNGVSLGDSVTLHGHVSSKWSDPFRLVWRDDERGVVAIGVQELILKPERPGIQRVTLDVCEAGDPQAAVSIGSSDRVVCPGVLASASHIVVVDILGNISARIEGPSQGNFGQTVRVRIVETNHDRVNQMPELFFYWQVNGGELTPSNRNEKTRDVPLREAKPYTIRAVIKQQYLGKLVTLAEATHRIVPSFPLKIEGPIRTWVNGGAMLKAVADLTGEIVKRPAFRFVWTDEGSGMRLGDSESLDLKTPYAGKYTIRVDAHMLDDERNQYVKLTDAKHTIVVEEPKARLSVVGPGRVRVDEAFTLSASIADANVPARDIYVSWGALSDGRRLPNYSSSFSTREGRPGTHRYVAEAYIKRDGKMLKLADAHHTVTVIEPEPPAYVPPPLSVPTTPPSGRIPAPPTQRTEQRKPQEPSRESILAEYRALVPQYVQFSRKPWHTKFNFTQVVQQIGPDKYRTEYEVFCVDDTGPNRGKEYLCSTMGFTETFAEAKTNLARMKKEMGNR